VFGVIKLHDSPDEEFLIVIRQLHGDLKPGSSP
jgi:hypothetical protein